MGFLERLFGGKPSKDKFAKIMTDALRQAGETGKLSYDPKEFRLVVEGEQRLLNLHNAYEDYCAAPKEGRPEVLKRYARATLSHLKEMPKEFSDARHDVLPTVRSRSYFEFARLQLQVQGEKDLPLPLHRVMAEHLAIALVYDLPESMRQIQEEELADWGVTFEQALAEAIDNLRKIAAQQFQVVKPGVWASPHRDNYDTARMLLNDVIREHSVKGEPVAMIPNRDTLLFTGTEDRIGLENMLALAEEGLSQSRPITGIPFRLNGASWEPYLPDRGHPLHQKFKLMWAKSLGMEYGDQSELLNSLHEKTRLDLFVASYSAIQKNDTGEIVSYSVWSKGVDTLLPRTDVIHFFVPNEESKGAVVATGDWDTVMRIVGHLMKPQGIYPERYRVSEFPSDAQLRQLSGK
jgi:uncharacterized protein YtpQ (UPF0354 family)